ncbi:50S ribosomal protein L7ae [archaeon]|mgnify:CR=1 FL=1|jgi:large subunit ribosomal protein L7Ae|nr:50S ribosomal protein L7ae [archaeon]MBT3731298.1 50S ribosomal protein L7ae [archaeon]MBT4669951.1 50S ribosomal protein L7ae [archaeon]MBT5029776.1 50S ribosomal protein L7ae [archaeon]MBT5287475.1 50S ribosomal protein L7ae [archaeon]
MDEKILVEKAYEAIEMAKASGGKIRKGSNEATKAIEKGIAKLVVVAKDTNPPEVIMHLKHLCKDKKALYIEVPSKVELGRAAGLPVGSSAVAIVQEGNAKTVLKQIEKALGEEDGSKE